MGSDLNVDGGGADGQMQRVLGSESGMLGSGVRGGDVLQSDPLTSAVAIREEFAVIDHEFTARAPGGLLGLHEQLHGLPTRTREGSQTAHRRLPSGGEHPADLLRLHDAGFRREAETRRLPVASISPASGFQPPCHADSPNHPWT